MNLGFKRIVSLARKRTKNPEKERKILQELLPEFAAIVPEDGGVIEKLSDIFFNGQLKYNSYVLEIGFGSGENIVFNAKNNPELGYIGCEVFTGGVVTLLEEIESNKLNNIRIWHDDALELISRLPLNSLGLVYILHPDPWPKTRHKKRRLINAEFLRLLAAKMAIGAEVLMITDHEDYANSIANVVEEVKDIFTAKFDNYPTITKTKYRMKADSLGVESKYFCLVKRALS
jgi:tRNA (guanine-N7-)-methyltransferase